MPNRLAAVSKPIEEQPRNNTKSLFTFIECENQGLVKHKFGGWIQKTEPNTDCGLWASINFIICIRHWNELKLVC